MAQDNLFDTFYAAFGRKPGEKMTLFVDLKKNHPAFCGGDEVYVAPEASDGKLLGLRIYSSDPQEAPLILLKKNRAYYLETTVDDVTITAPDWISFGKMLEEAYLAPFPEAPVTVMLQAGGTKEFVGYYEVK